MKIPACGINFPPLGAVRDTLPNCGVPHFSMWTFPSYTNIVHRFQAPHTQLFLQRGLSWGIPSAKTKL